MVLRFVSEPRLASSLKDPAHFECCRAGPRAVSQEHLGTAVCRVQVLLESSPGPAPAAALRCSAEAPGLAPARSSSTALAAVPADAGRLFAGPTTPSWAARCSTASLPPSGWAFPPVTPPVHGRASPRDRVRVDTWDAGSDGASSYSSSSNYSAEDAGPPQHVRAQNWFHRATDPSAAVVPGCQPGPRYDHAQLSKE